MKSTLFIFSVFAIAVCYHSVAALRVPQRVHDNGNSLQDIANRIVQQGALSPKSIGDTSLWQYMNSGLMANGGQNQTGLALSKITVNFTTNAGNSELVVSAVASVWGNDNTDILAIFYYGSDKTLDFYLQFDINLSQVPKKLVPQQAIAWYKGFSLFGVNTVTISSATFTDLFKNTYQKGVTISAKVQLNQQLPALKQIQSLTNNNTAIGLLTASFPLSAGDPVALLQILVDGSIYFGPNANIRSDNLVLSGVIGDTPTFKLATGLDLQVEGQWLEFQVSADVGSSEGVSFAGALQGTWKNAFGLSWLSFSSAAVQFGMGPTDKINILTFKGDAAVTFSSDPSIAGNFDIDYTGTGAPQYTLTFSASVGNLAQAFDQIVGVRPVDVDQIQFGGQATFVLTNFGAQAGLTIKASATVSGQGELASSAQVLAKVGNVPSLTFDADVYVPLFSANKVDFQFSLSEPSPINLSSAVSIDNLSLTYVRNPSTTWTFGGELKINFAEDPSNVLSFAVASTITSGQLNFNGNLDGNWNKPFGLNWLIVSDTSVTLTLDFATENVTAFTINTNSQVTFGNVGTTSIQLGTSPNGVTFALTVQVTVNDLGQTFDQIVGTRPADIDQIQFDGQATFVLTNTGAQPGLTVRASATVSGQGQLASSAQVLAKVGNVPSLTFDADVYVPLFSANKVDFQFSLSEPSPINLSSAVSIDKLSLTYVRNPSTTWTFGGELKIKFVEDPSNVLSFTVASTVTSGQLNFNGNLNGNWNKPFGLNWLIVSDTSVTLTLDFATEKVTAFTINTNSQVTFGDVGKTSIQLGTSPNGVTFVLTVQVTVNNLGQAFDQIVGTRPADVDQILVNGKATFVLTNTNSGSYQPGLTVSADAAVGGQGALASSVGVLSKRSKSPLNFDLELFVPVFSSDKADIQFSLSEPNPINLSGSVSLSNLLVKFALNPSVSASFDGKLNVQVQNDSLTFGVSADVSPSQLKFNGDLDENWSHPFGFDWLSLSDTSVTLSFDLTTSKLTSFTINSDGQITWGDLSSTTVDVNFNENLLDYTVTFDVLIPDLSVFLRSVVKSTPPPFTNEISATAAVTISNFDSGNVKTGLSVDGTALVLPNGKLSQKIRTLSPNGPLSFTLDLFVPVFSSNPADVDFVLSESGTFSPVSNIQLTGLSLEFDVVPTPKATLKTVGSITLNKNPEALQFNLAANINEADGLQFSGNLNGQWNNPFGLSWLEFKSISASLNFLGGKIYSLNLAGDAVVTWNSGQQQVTVQVATADNFVDTTVTISGVTIVSLPDAIKQIANEIPAELNDINTVRNTITIVISTYSQGSVREGLTISDTVEISGDLLKRLRVFNQNQGILQLSMDLTVPIFLAGVPNIVIDLDARDIYLNDRANLKDLEFQIQTSPLEISAKADFAITFAKNPTLVFEIDGTIETDGTVVFSGDLIGQWDNMFGIQGLEISNVDLALGFNPAFCAVDLCISAFGLGYTLTIGSKHFTFDGFVEMPDLAKVFFDASAKSDSGIVLSFRDVANGWNDIVGSNSPVHLNPENFPATWGLLNTEFYVAPEAGTFNQVHYDAGFKFEGGFSVLGVNCSVDVEVTSNDFVFDFSITVDEFGQMVRRELALDMAANPAAYSGWNPRYMQAIMSGGPIPVTLDGGLEFVVLGIQNVTVSKMGCSALANKSYPSFHMEYLLLNGLHSLDFGVEAVDLYSEFHNFFMRYLVDIFRGVKA